MRSGRTIALVVALISLLSTAGGEEIVVYRTWEHEKSTTGPWRQAKASELKAISETQQIVDSYILERRRDGTAKVLREFDPPSGDWRIAISYWYDNQGRLRRIRTDLLTFSGRSEGEGLTHCVRKYTVGPRGAIRRISKQVLDADSGKPVKRQFYDPESNVDHWLNISDLPIVPDEMERTKDRNSIRFASGHGLLPA